mgnify:CR=1 FL=1
MYKEYFGLKETPFSIAPDPHYFYISLGHREALAHLMYGLNSDGGFVLLTGEVGAGKTTVCRCLLQQVPDNCEVAFILNPKVTSIELLASICDEFKIPYTKSDETIKNLVSLINEFLIKASEIGRRSILIIEEAQNLSPEVLEQIRLLTNLETNQRKLLQIIMLGQPELKEVLAKPELRQLSQRITARYHLGPLAKEEIAGYVHHRLSVAGLVRGEPFPPSVLGMLYGLTKGVPRLINVICDRALLGAFTEGKDRVDRATLLTAAREVSGGSGNSSQRKRLRAWLAIILLIALLIGGVWLYGKETALFLSSHTGSPAKPVAKTSGENLGEASVAISSRDRAYQSLFGAWHITYDPKNSRTPCEQAQSQGLLCHQGKGDTEDLRRVNKPVLLRLVDGQGKDYYLTVTALRGDSATYSIDGETRTGDLKGTVTKWSGEYEVLWRLPQEYKDTLKPGGQGPLVAWVDNQLACIDGKKPRSRPKTTYDGDMVSRVKAFQAAIGLKPDGIVGPTTIAQLILRTGSEGPALADKKGVD